MRHSEFFRGGDGENSNSSVNNHNLNNSSISNPHHMGLTMNNFIRKDYRGGILPERSASSVQELLSYVNQHIFQDSPISQKQLANPTQKQFTVMFWGLMHNLDPTLNHKNETAPLEDIPLLLKFWNYPYPINKNMLITLGAPHTWQHVQTLLLWLHALTKHLSNAEAPQKLFNSQANNSNNGNNFFKLPSNSSNTNNTNTSNIEKSDVEILNQYIAKTFKRKDLSNNNLYNNSKMNSSKKQPITAVSSQTSSSKGSPIDEDKESKEVAEKLKQKSLILEEATRELEMKIETIRLANKNLCIKQPELTEINSKIESQQDLVNMEHEMIQEIVHENESLLKEIDNLTAQFNLKLMKIHELGQEKKKITQQVQEQEYSINDADKKVKEIERLGFEKGDIENHILQFEKDRKAAYSQSHVQISELAGLVKEYNEKLSNQNELFMQCQDIQVNLNQEKLHAETLEQLNDEGTIEQSQQPSQIQQQQSNVMSGGFMNTGILTQKEYKKKVISSMVSVPLKNVRNKLNELANEYVKKRKEKEEGIRVLELQSEEKKIKVAELEIKLKSVEMKAWQRAEELKTLTSSMLEKQEQFRVATEKSLQNIAQLNLQLAGLRQTQVEEENMLSSALTKFENAKAANLAIREQVSSLVEGQILKISRLKAEVIQKLTQLQLKYAELPDQIHAAAIAQQHQQQQQEHQQIF